MSAGAEGGSDGPPRTAASAYADRMDAAWRDFRRRVEGFPAERFGDRVPGSDWNIKQMLAHVAAWHDSASERLARFLVSGQPVELSETVDATNARAARGAEGRTGGEIVRWLDDSYARLRRLTARLTADHLDAHDGWARTVVAENTFEHHAEHAHELDAAES